LNHCKRSIIPGGRFACSANSESKKNKPESRKAKFWSGFAVKK
jgi:hypothetical protein